MTEKVAQKIGLVINANKTKNMATDKNYNNSHEIHFNTFERVDFRYLGSIEVTNSNTTNKIQQRISAANRCYFGLLKQMRSRLISISTKCTRYKTLIRPVLTYGAETRTITKVNERRLLTLERKMFREFIV